MAALAGGAKTRGESRKYLASVHTGPGGGGRHWRIDCRLRSGPGSWRDARACATGSRECCDSCAGSSANFGSSAGRRDGADVHTRADAGAYTHSRAEAQSNTDPGSRTDRYGNDASGSHGHAYGFASTGPGAHGHFRTDPNSDPGTYGAFD